MRTDAAHTPVVVDGLRTPFGRYGGALAGVRPDDMAAHVIRVLVERNGVDPAGVDDVILGAANQAGEDNRNVGRMAGLLAGFPVEVPGSTVNRLCGSGMNAVVNAAHAVIAGDGSLFVAGGVESMTRAPLVMAKPSAAFPRGEQTLYDTTLGWRFTNPRLADAYYPYSMGETAENVVERCGVTREEQDAFALESQRRWAAAHAAGRFAEEVVPIEAPAGRETRVVDTDEHPRPDTTMDTLAALKPAFRRDESGSVTAGNSSGINDGAAAVLVTSEARARELGLRPVMRMLSSAVAGVDPATMGLGPIPASRRALERAGLSVDDLDLVELNEAFAAQAIPCIRELGLDPEKVNVNGGAIAIGHPLGASGARLVATLMHEMRRRGARHGLATMCIGVGQGIATVWEAVE
ncbi:MAG TPA: thiolase family protein [candidate division Zixibacteria bacterium]|nr:thiolase family protein [candidate division Zixibacteria bacterium]